jgi:late competence protein required for DNA uptake (superfamily II DNA/RNA helicase)
LAVFLIAIIGGFYIISCIVYGLNKARADGYKYKPKEYTREQKIWQGKIKKKNIQLVD